MDPDRALADLREAIASAEDWDLVQELWEGLDEWLKYAGFLPQAWVDAYPRPAR